MNKTNIRRIIKPDEFFQGKERENIIEDLTMIARNGFGSEITREDVENHVLKTGILYLMSKNNNKIGFASYDRMRLENKELLYLHGIVVKQEHQQEGLFYKVNNAEISQNNFDFIAMRTQNPVIYAATRKIVKDIYPGKKPIPTEIKELGKIVAEDFLQMNNFDPTTFIGRGTYSVSLYGAIPQYANAEINEFFDKQLNLDYDAGDSVLIVGKLK
ncbi:MAG: hypothetical protein KKF46_04665 [Nanoarchaeota archaeon]|nr:hypothetical protein [Nanoarchaeota archaeon]MBU1321626.1 hypothetical protein [Nanoarchaeota archaeon]MBU1597410.1 hypothetical protein [Nanoarchaeota archaeon]MBU2440927.1 hypothetical protein [Nanoarchaeota archaeon]